MANHARKRQKTKKTEPSHVQPLGSARNDDDNDDANKDDEERQLESLLFGKSLAAPASDPEDDDDDDDEPLRVDKELHHLTDADLFFVDDGDTENHPDHPEDSEQDENDLADENEDHEDSNVPPPSQPPSKNQLAWIDPDDASLQVSLTSNKRRLKLRDSLLDDNIGGREYERRLRRQFQRIHPTPEWASTARQKLHPSKRRRPSTSSASASENNDDEPAISDLVSSTVGILDAPKKNSVIPQGHLKIERLRDANQSSRPDGHIKAIQFHPSPHVPVLLTANSDRRLSLFNIDGLTNPHLQTIHIPTLPLTNATFHPTGSSILLTGPRPFYYTHNLQSGTTHRSPRGLWGTTFNRSNPSTQDLTMSACAFNPTGSILAVAGRSGHIHLVDWNSGAGQVFASLKMNASVKSLWWSPSPNTENQLLSLADNSEVYVWDVGQRRCTQRWRDDGEFGSAIITGDPTGKYLAIGARTGYVNVYNHHHHQNPPKSSNKPGLLKAIANLITPISTLRFNHDAQLLAIASNSKKNQMRLIHLPSLTAFANWPTTSTPLSHVTSIDFSAGSEYLAIGNNRGHVLLYHLQDYGIQ